MTTLNDFNKVDDDDDVMAAHINDLISASLLSEYQNVETLSNTRTLLDADTPLQRFNCNGANRIVKSPTPDLEDNHPYLLVNSTASGTYTLTVQNNDGTIDLAVLNPSEFLLMIPDGNGTYSVFGRPFQKVLTPSQITSNQDNYNPTGAGYADVIRISSDAARNITGLAFPAGNKSIVLINAGSYTITLKNDTTSTAANRFLIGADFALETNKSVLLIYDATASRWRMVGGAGNTGLAISSAAVTTSNVTGVVRTRHVLDVSGMTANRNFVLPAGASGDEIEVHLSVGDATYALILIGDTGISINGGTAATEWSRLFISGETVRFVATSASNWEVIVDGRIPCKTKIKDTGTQNISTGTTTLLTLDETDYDNASCADTTNKRINIRRANKYIVTGGVALDSLAANATRVFGSARLNGSAPIAVNEISGLSGGYPSLLPATTYSLVAGDYLDLVVYHNSGSTEPTYVTNSPTHLEMTEVLP